MNILGVKINEYNHKIILDKVVGFLNSNNQYKIFTPNPEMLVDAQKDEYFKKVLNNGDLNLCDGFGLSLVSGIKRITGVDFMIDICQIAEKKGSGVYLLGSNNNEVLKKTAKNLQKQFSKLKIVGFNKGNELRIENYELRIIRENNSKIIDEINNSKASILFVAFGHNKQEKWIYENLNKMPNIKIAMGVGGAFDYISGQTKRAPKFMRKLGLEWLYRLYKQPKRINRIFKATILFNYFIFKNRLSKIML